MDFSSRWIPQASKWLGEGAKAPFLVTKTPISQIAFELGFEYTQNFCQVFKIKRAISPQSIEI